MLGEERTTRERQAVKGFLLGGLAGGVMVVSFLAFLSAGVSFVAGLVCCTGLAMGTLALV